MIGRREFNSCLAEHKNGEGEFMPTMSHIENHIITAAKAVRDADLIVLRTDFCLWHNCALHRH
jgi:hypothetical protein